MTDRTGACNCYVRHLRPEIQFATRCGAHNPSCPWYRPSLDPVDRLKDEAFRAAVELTAPTSYEADPATEFAEAIRRIIEVGAREKRTA